MVRVNLVVVPCLVSQPSPQSILYYKYVIPLSHYLKSTSFGMLVWFNSVGQQVVLNPVLSRQFYDSITVVDVRPPVDCFLSLVSFACSLSHLHLLCFGVLDTTFNSPLPSGFLLSRDIDGRWIGAIWWCLIKDNLMQVAFTLILVALPPRASFPKGVNGHWSKFATRQNIIFDGLCGWSSTTTTSDLENESAA